MSKVRKNILKNNDVVKKEIENSFMERLKDSKIFSNNEICKIKKDIIQYEKCYLLGMCDFEI